MDFDASAKLKLQQASGPLASELAEALNDRAIAAHANESSQEEILVLSGNHLAALNHSVTTLCTFLRDHPLCPLRPIAKRLQAVSPGTLRVAIVAQCSLEAIEALQTSLAMAVRKPPYIGLNSIAFMFPGIGPEYVGMAEMLYKTDPTYREEFDACADAFAPHIMTDIRELVFPQKRDALCEARLSATAHAQPAIFAVEIALAKLLISWNIQPAALIGHSIGEYAAAHLAGVFNLSDLGIIAAGSAQMRKQPRGAMLAVRLSATELTPMLGPGAWIAAYNAPNLNVVAGNPTAIGNLEERLRVRKTWFSRLNASHAFHSPMMDGAVQALSEAMQRVSFNRPLMPWISSLTGDWITEEQAMSPAYWARQFRSPVRFSSGLQRLLNSEHKLLVEVGPGNSLATFTRHQRTFRGSVIPSIGVPIGSDARKMKQAVASLWVRGVAVDWQALR